MTQTSLGESVVQKEIHKENQARAKIMVLMLVLPIPNRCGYWPK